MENTNRKFNLIFLKTSFWSLHSFFLWTNHLYFETVIFSKKKKYIWNNTRMNRDLFIGETVYQKIFSNIANRFIENTNLNMLSSAKCLTNLSISRIHFHSNTFLQSMYPQCRFRFLFSQNGHGMFSFPYLNLLQKQNLERTRWWKMKSRVLFVRM